MNTRQHCNLHQPLPSLTEYQIGVYYLGIKGFSNFLSYIETVSDNPKQFKSTLKKFSTCILLLLFQRIFSFRS